MKSIVIFTIISILLAFPIYGQKKYWEDLSSMQKDEILENCKSIQMKKFIEDKFVPTDDENTRGLLKELVSSNDTILPLSFYLLNKLRINSDGALTEMVNNYCINFLAMHAQYVLNYFSKERILKVNKPIWKKYASSVGYELYFKIEGTSLLKYSYKNLKEIVSDASKGNKENEETFRVFWQLVDETIKNMN